MITSRTLGLLLSSLLCFSFTNNYKNITIPGRNPFNPYQADHNEELKGNVKSIVETHCDSGINAATTTRIILDTSGKLLRRTVDSSGIVKEDFTIKYDGENNPIESNGFYIRKKITTRTKTYYTYDQQGKLTEIRKYSRDDSSSYLIDPNATLDSLNWQAIFTYDNDGYLWKEEEHYLTGRDRKTVTHVFDRNGNEIENDVIKTDGHLERKTIYKKDSSGKLLEDSRFDSVGNLKTKLVNHLDSKGNLIENDEYDSADVMDRRLVWDRDSQENITTERIFGKKGMLESRTEYVRVKDEYGNAIDTAFKYRGDGCFLDKNIIIRDSHEHEIKSFRIEWNGEVRLPITNNKYQYDEKGNWIEQINDKKMGGNCLKRTIEYY